METSAKLGMNITELFTEIGACIFDLTRNTRPFCMHDTARRVPRTPKQASEGVKVAAKPPPKKGGLCALL